MSEQFESFINACAQAVKSKDKVLPPEFLAAAKTVGEKVESWGVEAGLMAAKKFPRGGGEYFVPNSKISADSLATSVGAEKIAELIASCEVAPIYKEAAAKKVAAILSQVMGYEKEDAFTAYSSNIGENAGELVSLESLYGADLWAAISPATEAFGIQMDRVTPDLKTILTIALLQFHVSLTPRILPIQSVTQSNVQITREMMEVFDMSKPDEPPMRVIDLYWDPSMVSVKATRIVPLMKNDAAGKYLVAEGIYKFEEELNLFKLALDTTRPGYDRFNHTDIVEDGIMVDAILVKVTKGNKAEEFMINLPPDRARLTQVPNDYRSTLRRLTLDRTALLLNADSAVYGSTSKSEIFASLTASSGKSVKIRINLTVDVDRKTGDAKGSCWGKTSIFAIDPTMITADDEALASDVKVEFEGFMLDARYNEDNKRKTSIRAEINRRNMSYELPSGRNFVMDFAIGQEGAVNAAARLAQIEHIGRDGNNLKIITDTLTSLHDRRMSMGYTAEANADIGATYAAGDMVHQTAINTTIEFGTGFLAVRSSDASGDTKEFVRRRLNKFVTGLMATSLLPEQLAQGTEITLRAITSPFILGMILSAHHIHAHLDTLDQRGTGSVQYVMQLDCGVKLEIITTTFKSMNDKMVIIPFFESAPTSVLNFGTNFDQGTLVGAVSLGADQSSVHNRIFSTTREATIPTNVVGAVITFIGLGDVKVGLDYPGFADESAGEVELPAGGEGDAGIGG